MPHLVEVSRYHSRVMIISWWSKRFRYTNNHSIQLLMFHQSSRSFQQSSHTLSETNMYPLKMDQNGRPKWQLVPFLGFGIFPGAILVILGRSIPPAKVNPSGKFTAEVWFWGVVHFLVVGGVVDFIGRFHQIHSLKLTKARTWKWFLLLEDKPF